MIISAVQRAHNIEVTMTTLSAHSISLANSHVEIVVTRKISMQNKLLYLVRGGIKKNVL